MVDRKVIIISVIFAIVIIAAIIYFSISSPEGSFEQEKPNPVAEQCAFACETSQKAAFCDVVRTADSGITATCNELATNPNYAKYNVQSCTSISCVPSQELDQTCVTGLNGIWATPTAGTCPVQEGKTARERTSSDNPSVAGQICCYYYE